MRPSLPAGTIGRRRSATRIFRWRLGLSGIGSPASQDRLGHLLVEDFILSAARCVDIQIVVIDASIRATRGCTLDRTGGSRASRFPVEGRHRGKGRLWGELGKWMPEFIAGIEMGTHNSSLVSFFAAHNGVNPASANEITFRLTHSAAASASPVPANSALFRPPDVTANGTTPILPSAKQNTGPTLPFIGSWCSASCWSS